MAECSLDLCRDMSFACSSCNTEAKKVQFQFMPFAPTDTLRGNAGWETYVPLTIGNGQRRRPGRQAANLFGDGGVVFSELQS